MPQDDLLEFVQSVSGDAHLAIEETLGDGFVRLKTAEAERRQAKHDIRCVEDIVIEMLRNSRDAGAHAIYLATSRDGNARTLTFIDDGAGIPGHMHEAIFEPRVTSKLETMVMDNWGVHGRGMALYSIKSNSTSARVASSAERMGAALVVEVDVDELGERADQSSLPVLDLDEAGQPVVSSGAHNIVRTLVEFALDARDAVDVYVGSPAEIVATLVRSGKKELSDSQLLFCDDLEELPVVVRLAAAADAAELARIADSLGLSISERTAHRVLAGQIPPVAPVLDDLLRKLAKKGRGEKEPDIYRDGRGLKISKDDLADFARSLEQSFAALSRRYYIDLTDEPIIRIGKDAITVKFPFDKEL